MAQPGDPKQPDARRDTDLDDLVGFASPASLAGRPRPPAPDPAPAPAAPAEPEPDLFDPPPPPELDRGDPLPAWARETPAPPPRPAAVRSGGPSAGLSGEAPEIAGGMGLFAVYALILFAVPTLGASALIALLAVTGRPAPEDPLAASHFIFQQRTLWAAAVAAVAGVILVIVNLGVFVLFVLALWLIFRGAWGVLRLKGGRPIDHPRRWLV